MGFSKAQRQRLGFVEMTVKKVLVAARSYTVTSWLQRSSQA